MGAEFMDVELWSTPGVVAAETGRGWSRSSLILVRTAGVEAAEVTGMERVMLRHSMSEEMSMKADIID